MTRLTIARLALDLRGVPPATAEAAVRLLGPALERALTARRVSGTARARDAGRIALSVPPDAPALAAELARRIADHTSEG
jgi:hypothetical protein